MATNKWTHLQPQMCYWRRLSKRSADDFEYEYTTNSSSSNSELQDADSDSLAISHQPSVISDSVNLFKALQVRQGPEPSSQKQRLDSASFERDVFGQDNEAQLVCYRYAEVLVFLLTVGGVLVLICTVAIVCCLRARKLTRNHFDHNRLGARPSSGSGSVSPSLASLCEANLLSRGSLIATPVQVPRPLASQQIYDHPQQGNSQSAHVSPRWKPSFYQQCNLTFTPNNKSKSAAFFVAPSRKQEFG